MRRIYVASSWRCPEHPVVVERPPDLFALMVGPAGSMVETSAGTLSIVPEGATVRQAAEELLDRALRSWEGDAEDYIRDEATPVEALARRVFDVLTSHDLDPSTRDLLTIIVNYGERGAVR